MCHAEVGERVPLSVSIFFPGKKVKTTPDAGEKSVSEKSQATRTCRNPFEKSKSKQTEFFVREVKDKRMTKNGPEFLIGWRDFPLERDDTWEPISNLTKYHLLKEMILGNL